MKAREKSEFETHAPVEITQSTVRLTRDGELSGTYLIKTAAQVTEKKLEDPEFVRQLLADDRIEWSRATVGGENMYHVRVLPLDARAADGIERPVAEIDPTVLTVTVDGMEYDAKSFWVNEVIGRMIVNESRKFGREQRVKRLLSDVRDLVQRKKR